MGLYTLTVNTICHKALQATAHSVASVSKQHWLSVPFGPAV